MYPPDPHGVKKWGDMTPPAPMGAPPLIWPITQIKVSHKFITLFSSSSSDTGQTSSS